MTIKTTRHYADHWTAIDDDSYDGPSSPMGHGRTEQEAVAALLEKLEEIETAGKVFRRTIGGAWSSPLH